MPGVAPGRSLWGLQPPQDPVPLVGVPPATPTPISQPNADLDAQCKVKRAQMVRNLRRWPWSGTQHRALGRCPARSPRWPVPASASDAGTTAPQPTDTGSGTESAPARLPHPGPPKLPGREGLQRAPPCSPLSLLISSHTCERSCGPPAGGNPQLCPGPGGHRPRLEQLGESAADWGLGGGHHF